MLTKIYLVGVLFTLGTFCGAFAQDIEPELLPTESVVVDVTEPKEITTEFPTEITTESPTTIGPTTIGPTTIGINDVTTESPSVPTTANTASTGAIPTDIDLTTTTEIVPTTTDVIPKTTTVVPQVSTTTTKTTTPSAESISTTPEEIRPTTDIIPKTTTGVPQVSTTTIQTTTRKHLGCQYVKKKGVPYFCWSERRFVIPVYCAYCCKCRAGEICYYVRASYCRRT